MGRCKITFVEVEAKPLLEHFVAEVRVARPVPRWSIEIKAAVRELLWRYHILLFRDMALTMEDQVDFTLVFGELEPAWDSHHTHRENPLVQIISNAGRDQISYKSATLHWHTDESFVARPPRFTVLNAIEIPASGGRTLFADLMMAYADYMDAGGVPLTRLRAVHSFEYLMAPMVATRISVDAARVEIERFPDVIHPLVRKIHEMNRGALFLNELCIKRIDGLQPHDSLALLEDLYVRCTQPKYLYAHSWKVGDVVIWDNACLMHRAEDIPVAEARVFHRTSTQGEIPTALDGE